MTETKDTGQTEQGTVSDETGLNGLTCCDLLSPYYSDDYVTIYHGDCIDLLPRIGPVDLLLTDPPYGVTYQSNRMIGRGVKPITNDGTRLSLALYRQILPLLEVDQVLWFTRWDAWPDVWAILGQYHPLKGLLIWDKGTPGMGDLDHWGLNYEMIASAGAIKIQGGRDGSILKYNGVSPNDRKHPTEKPITLLQYLIQKVSPESIIDPFMGSGSTLLAAKNLGMRCIGIETSEEYCERAANRMLQEVLPFNEPTKAHHEVQEELFQR